MSGCRAANEALKWTGVPLSPGEHLGPHPSWESSLSWWHQKGPGLRDAPQTDSWSGGWAALPSEVRARGTEPRTAVPGPSFHRGLRDRQSFPLPGNGQLRSPRPRAAPRQAEKTSLQCRPEQRQRPAWGEWGHPAVGRAWVLCEEGPGYLLSHHWGPRAPLVQSRAWSLQRQCLVPQGHWPRAWAWVEAQANPESHLPGLSQQVRVGPRLQRVPATEALDQQSKAGCPGAVAAPWDGAGNPL